MPALWLRFADDTMLLVVAFLLVVALPAHAFVVGFERNLATSPRTVDTAMLKRVGAWLLSATLAIGVAHALRA